MTQIEQFDRLPEFSVSEISALLKRTVEDAYPFVRIKGELSNFKKAPSGHIYMNIKDEGAVLAAICWKGTAMKFRFKPEDGMEVKVTGRITTYPGQSKYQIIVDNMEPAGLGALMELLEKRKKKLAAEGLFDSDRKKPIPFMPKTIGVVTSPTGAVIRDILHRIEDRFPCHVLVWPVLVQGEKAAGQISAAVSGFNQLNENKPDVIIVARGGGSLEDLWPFNEEMVVRAVANSKIPVISAVGHETDTTLVDYAADLRAPTPTAAAEKAVPIKNDLLLWVSDLEKRLLGSFTRFIDYKKNDLRSLYRALPKPSALIDESFQKIDYLALRLANAFPKLIEDKEKQINFISRLLESYHYKKVLGRGFVLVRKGKNSIKTKSSQINAGDRLTLEFADGTKDVIAEGKKPTTKNGPSIKQESLF